MFNFKPLKKSKIHIKLFYYFKNKKIPILLIIRLENQPWSSFTNIILELRKFLYTSSFVRILRIHSSLIKMKNKRSLKALQKFEFFYVLIDKKLKINSNLNKLIYIEKYCFSLLATRTHSVWQLTKFEIFYILNLKTQKGSNLKASKFGAFNIQITANSEAFEVRKNSSLKTYKTSKFPEVGSLLILNQQSSKFLKIRSIENLFCLNL